MKVVIVSDTRGNYGALSALPEFYDRELGRIARCAAKSVCACWKP